LKKSWQHITHNGICPSTDLLILYYKGKLSGGESFAIENHIASCEICTDLLEGIAELKNIDSLTNIEAELKQQLNKNLWGKKTKQRFLPVYQRIAIAASILLIIGISVVVYHNVESPMKPVAQEITQKPPSKDEKNETLKESTIQHPEFKSEEKKKLRTPLPVRVSRNAVTMSDIQFDDKKEPAANTKVKTKDSVIISSPVALASDNKIAFRSNSQPEKSENFDKSSAKIEYDKDQIVDKNIVKGRVIDESGSPLPGVNVIIKGTTKGVVTDLDGQFTIALNKTDDVLEISYVGYKNRELAVINDENMKIALDPDVKALDEVVVVGYGVQKKSQLTGAITNVSDSKRKGKQKNKNDETLKGKMSGASITTQEATGQKLDSLKMQQIDTLKSVIEKHLELKNKNEALEKLFELNTLITEEKEKKEIEDIVQLTKEEKYSKALKKLKKIN
jgi:CarboxypepD_reg-like domain